MSAQRVGFGCRTVIANVHPVTFLRLAVATFTVQRVRLEVTVVSALIPLTLAVFVLAGRLVELMASVPVPLKKLSKPVPVAFLAQMGSSVRVMDHVHVLLIKCCT